MSTEYSKPFQISVDGKPLLEAMSVDDDISSEDKPVKTLAKGLSGFSDGAASCKVSIKSAVPRAGYEVDFANYVATHKTCTIQVRGAGKLTTYVGRFLTTKSTSSVDNPNEATAEFEGSFLSRVAI